MSSTSTTEYDYAAYYASFTSSTTQKPVVTRTNSPFYYGLNYGQSKSSTTTTTRFPPYRSPSSTSPPTTRTTTTTKSPFVFGHVFTSSSPAPTKTTKGSSSSSTRNPVFDVYLNRLNSTTRSPYNFDNFAQYFKTSTSKPRYSYNLVGANSQALAVSQTSSSSSSSRTAAIS